MRRLLIALVLLTLSFPSLAWTSSSVYMEGAKGWKTIDLFGKEQVLFLFYPYLTALSRAAHPNDKIMLRPPGPSVDFDFSVKCFRNPQDESIKVQGTMVRMSARCDSSGLAASGYGLKLFPSSEAGARYVFNTFKTSKVVIVETTNYAICEDPNNSRTGSCIFKIDTSDFHVIEEEEAFSGGL
jgi:hypothetical protein